MKHKKTGFFGGTFDPIHIGHINFALEILEKSDLDEILFCPVYLSPHKVKNKPLAPAKERFEMCSLAIEGIDGFSLESYEINREYISYTIDTLNVVNSKLKIDSELVLILSDDVFLDFKSWKKYNEIIEKYQIIIGKRTSCSNNLYLEEYKNLSEKKIIKTNIFEISSTDIRKRLKSGLYCNHLLMPKVLDYITQNDLYLGL